MPRPLKTLPLRAPSALKQARPLAVRRLLMGLVRLKLVALELKLVAPGVKPTVLLVAPGVKPTALAWELRVTVAPRALPALKAPR